MANDFNFLKRQVGKPDLRDGQRPSSANVRLESLTYDTHATCTASGSNATGRRARMYPM